MFDLQPWQWALMVLGAFLAVVSKTGITGVGVFTVAIFANLLPARQSTGVLLPLLVCADVAAVASYRQHTVWAHLWRLFPWVAAGIFAGYFALGRTNDAQLRRTIGAILVVLVALQAWLRSVTDTHGVWLRLGWLGLALACSADALMQGVKTFPEWCHELSEHKVGRSQQSREWNEVVRRLSRFDEPVLIENTYLAVRRGGAPFILNLRNFADMKRAGNFDDDGLVGRIRGREFQAIISDFPLEDSVAERALPLEWRIIMQPRYVLRETIELVGPRSVLHVYEPK